MRNDQYPLHIAAQNGQIAVIDELLKDHNVNEPDDKGNTALHYAVTGMQDQAAIHLLKKKADASLVNIEGNTPLHLYAAGGDQRGSAILNSEKKSAFASKAIYIANAKGETPLHVAIAKDNLYFFTHFVKPLGHRYYEAINFRSAVFWTGPEGDSLVYVALKRLSNPDLVNNEDRTYTMLYLLAGEIPEMFTVKRAKSMFSSQTLAEFSVENKLPERFTVLIGNAHTIYLDSFAQKQMLGQLQQTLNGQTDLIQELQKEVLQLKGQLALLAKPVQESKQLSQLFTSPKLDRKEGESGSATAGIGLNNNNSKSE